MTFTIDSRDLKQQLKNIHDNCSEEFSVRIRRAMSWMQRAEQEYNKEAGIRFIFLWIGFNALYGQYIPSDKSSESKEAKIFRDFLGKILSLDSGNKVHSALWCQPKVKNKALQLVSSCP